MMHRFSQLIYSTSTCTSTLISLIYLHWILYVIMFPHFVIYSRRFSLTSCHFATLFPSSINLLATLVLICKTSFFYFFFSFSPRVNIRRGTLTKKSALRNLHRLLRMVVDSGAPGGTNASTEVNIVTRHSCISAKAEKNKFHNLWLYFSILLFKEYNINSYFFFF